LDLRTAAVEVLNVLRPTVAIAWYVVFAAHALYQHPEAREKIRREPAGQHAGSYTDAFMQEVRRFYPFTPYLGARTRTSFTWKGYEFPAAALVLLDVYGTEHDPRVWANADQFRPERFLDWTGGEFDLIPQGGGSHRHGHRCPGEWLTMHSIALALHYLTRCCEYDIVSGQDLTIDLRRMPTQPASGFVLRDVRLTDALARPAPTVPSESATRGRPNVQPLPSVGATSH
jgi:fatty-acid peroxygenase